VTSCEHTGGNALQGRHIPFTGKSRDQFAIRQAKSWERCHTQGSMHVGAVPHLPRDNPLIGLQDGRRLCDEAEAGSPAAELRRARRPIVIAERNSQGPNNTAWVSGLSPPDMIACPIPTARCCDKNVETDRCRGVCAAGETFSCRAGERDLSALPLRVSCVTDNGGNHGIRTAQSQQPPQ